MSHRNKTLISTFQSLPHNVFGLVVQLPLDHNVIDLCKFIKQADFVCVDSNVCEVVRVNRGPELALGVVRPTPLLLLLQDLVQANHRCAMVKLALQSSDWIR